MSNDEWNKRDRFVLVLYSSDNPLERGFEGLEDVLDLIESADEELRPDRIYSGKRKRKYSRKVLWDHLPEMGMGPCTTITLDRSRGFDVVWFLYFWSVEDRIERFSVELKISPYSLVRGVKRTDVYVKSIVEFARAFGRRFPIAYGLGHSWVDFCSGKDPRTEDPFAPDRVYEAYWLNVYSSRLVREIGRERVLSTPAAHLEELPGGSVLWLTRPTPADFDSEEARLAQARALVHLRPELNLETVLATLRQRSLIFTPIPVTFDEDVADILWKEVEFQGLQRQRENVERFNVYRPPPVSEWMPANQMLESDVEDVRQAIETYEGLHAEQFTALMHSEKVPGVMEGKLEALPEVDFHLWHLRWGERKSEEAKEALVPALGAWLGMFLVHTLGGRWVPRLKLEESAVVVGDRAWLPFLRARHALQGREAPLDYSCSQFFRQAQRLARAEAH